jgi:hypothetical protein
MPPPDELGDNARQQVIDMLDGRLDGVSAPQRERMLTNITDLFVGQFAKVGGQATAVFDEVFLRLIAGVEIPALESLSARLAQIDKAPARTLRQVASHTVATVAAPVLSGSTALTSEDLAAIAATASQEHLLALAARTRIDESLSAILVASGEAAVIDRLLANPGAHFTIEDFGAALPRVTTDARGRFAFRQPAIILSVAGRRAGRCVTLDMSPGGIKLQAGPDVEMADLFKLELPNIGRMRLECRVAWRQNPVVGVQFTRPLAEQFAVKAVKH